MNRYDPNKTDESIEMVVCHYCHKTVPISCCTQEGYPMMLKCSECQDEQEIWFDYLNPPESDEDLI